MHKTGQDSQRAPDDQGVREQTSCAPAFHQERPGNLQREITDKENSARRAIHRIGQAPIAFHAELGVGDIGAIKIVRDVEEEKKRQQPPRDSTTRTCPGVYLRIHKIEGLTREGPYCPEASTGSKSHRHAEKSRRNRGEILARAPVLAGEELFQLFLQISRTTILLGGFEGIHRRSIIFSEFIHKR